MTVITLAQLGADLAEAYAEIDRLRAVAWQLHGAMIDQHEWAGHILNDECTGCDEAWRHCDSSYACNDYQRWQKAYVDALGLVIGEKP